jgi:hypothetical protein
MGEATAIQQDSIRCAIEMLMLSIRRNTLTLNVLQECVGKDPGRPVRRLLSECPSP